MKSKLVLAALCGLLLAGLGYPLEVKPAENDKRVIDGLRAARQRALYPRSLTRASRMSGEPGQALEVLEDPDQCPPQMREAGWQEAWRQCQRRRLEVLGSFGAAAFSGNGKVLMLLPASSDKPISLRDTSTGA